MEGKLAHLQEKTAAGKKSKKEYTRELHLNFTARQTGKTGAKI